MVGRGGAAGPLALADAYVFLGRFWRDSSAIASERLGRGVVLSNREHEVLTLLLHGSRSPSGLAGDLGALPSSLSRTLRRLRASGLIDVVGLVADGRARSVALSQLARRRQAGFADALRSHINPELDSLLETADRIGIHLDAVPVTGRSDALARAAAMVESRRAYHLAAATHLSSWSIHGSSQMQALALLGARGGERLTPLAAELGLTTQATSAVILRLVENGLAERIRTDRPADGRAALTSLTRDGDAASRTVFEVFAQNAPLMMRSIATPSAIPNRDRWR